MVKLSTSTILTPICRFWASAKARIPDSMIEPTNPWVGPIIPLPLLAEMLVVRIQLCLKMGSSHRVDSLENSVFLVESPSVVAIREHLVLPRGGWGRLSISLKRRSSRLRASLWILGGIRMVAMAWVSSKGTKQEIVKFNLGKFSCLMVMEGKVVEIN